MAAGCGCLHGETFERLRTSTAAVCVNRPRIVINSFAPTSTTLRKPRPAFSNNFETQLPQPIVIDDIETVKADDFERVIYDYARILSAHDYFEGDILVKAMQNVFTSAFAVMANQFLVHPVSVPTRAAATYYIDESRLIVVQDVAYAILAILSAVLVLLIWIGVYTRSHHSIQYEEAKGLVGAAAVLRDSDLMSMIALSNAGACGGEVTKEFQQRNQQRGWKFENWDTPDSAKIIMVQNVKPYGLPFLRR